MEQKDNESTGNLAGILGRPPSNRRRVARSPKTTKNKKREGRNNPHLHVFADG